MQKYQAPPGYQQDMGSGLYYKETQTTAPDGQPVRHIYWFNAETGEYAQKTIHSGKRQELTRKM